MYNQYGYGNYMPQQNYQSPTQQRLMQMEQMQMQQQMQPMQQQSMQMQQPQGSIIKPVTSLEEVRGITPNFDGSKMYFEDVTNNKMYVKYIDLNGLPITKVFKLDDSPAPTNTTIVSDEYITKKEFEDLKIKIEKYEGIINQFIEGGSNNE